jgi:RHS repeat-associated protein
LSSQRSVYPPSISTGKERDTETGEANGNDYFGVRYFGSSMGRFLSPDPLMASAMVWDPQTWNRYTYGRNNPLRMIDPTGLAEVTADQCAKDKHCVTVNVNNVVWDKNSHLRQVARSSALKNDDDRREAVPCSSRSLR